VASIGTLVANLSVNTRGFDSPIQAAQAALQSFSKTAKLALDTVANLDSMRINRDLPQQLETAAMQMTALQKASLSASQSVGLLEQTLNVTAAAAGLAAVGVRGVSASSALLASGAVAVSTGMTTALIQVIAVRKTLATLSFAFGLMAAGVRVLLMPINLFISALKVMLKSTSILLWPLKAIASALMMVAKVTLAIVSPMLTLAGTIAKVYVWFKALQLQAKIIKYILELLPPKVKAIAVGLMALGAASKVASAAFNATGAAGRLLASVLSKLLFPVKALLSPLKTLKAAIDTVTGAVKRLAAVAVSPFTAMFTAVASLTGLGGVLKLASDAETLQLRFRVLTRDAGKAAQVMKDVSKFADTTPFSKMEIGQAASQLLAFGSNTETLITELRMLGNIAAATGMDFGELADIYGKNRQQGRLYMMDINQLQSRGINITAQLAKKFGDVRQAVEEGRVGFVDLQAALMGLASGTGEWAGMTETLAQSMGGMFSTLKDNLTRIGETIGLEIMPYAKELLAWANNLLGAFNEIPNKLTFMKDALGAIFDVAIEGIKLKWSALLDWFVTETKKRAGGIAGSVLMFVPNLVGDQIGKMIGRRNGFQGQQAAPDMQLNAAIDRLSGLMAQLRPEVTGPAQGMAAGIAGALQMAIAQIPAPALGGHIGTGFADLLESVQIKGDEIGWGIRGILDRMQIRGNALANWFSAVFGGEFGSKQKTEQQSAGALQRGSQEAYSAIVRAMNQNADPQVAAINKQTGIFEKGLNNVVKVLEKKGPLALVNDLLGAK
jgi:hypothetical protein